jgi:hypothetical protein
MANSPLLLLFSSAADFWGRPEDNALDFLVEHFTVLGIDFQWWMPMTLLLKPFRERHGAVAVQGVDGS